MNGKPLNEIDEIIYNVCTLCWNHEKEGFIEGVKVGINLTKEIKILAQGPTHSELGLVLVMPYIDELLRALFALEYVRHFKYNYIIKCSICETLK